MLRWCPVQFSCGWFSWFWLICSKIPMVSMLQVRPRCEMSPVQVLILAVIFLLCAENVDVTWVPCLEYHCLEFLFARCPFFLSLCLIFKIVLARNIALSNSLLARVTWHGQWRTGAWQACVLTLVTEADTMISSNPVGLRPLPRNLRVWKCFVPGWGFVSPRRSCSRFKWTQSTGELFRCALALDSSGWPFLQYFACAHAELSFWHPFAAGSHSCAAVRLNVTSSILKET